MTPIDYWNWNPSTRLWEPKKPTTVVRINKNEDNFDTYIGRSGHGYEGWFGNPFKSGTREQNIESFRRWFHTHGITDSAYLKRLLSVTGHRLGCFCKPLPCHGDVMAEYLNTCGPWGKGLSWHP